MSRDGTLPDRIGRLAETADELPLAPSFVGGVVAFLCGYVLFVATVIASGSPNLSTPVATAKQLGGLFYNAHNVPLVDYREVLIGDQVSVRQIPVNLIQLGDPSLPRPVYYAVPVVTLAIVAGVLAWRYVDATDPTRTAVAVVGGMTLGYVLSVMAGTVLFAQETAFQGAPATLAPATLESLAFGVAYPLGASVLLVGVVVAVRRRAD